jgi:transcriptional regulator of acetoin/glycerol metabolism
VAARHGRALRFSPDALRTLLDYAWSGNVRELENALEYAVAVCKGQTILPEDLPAELQAPAPSVVATEAEPASTRRSSLPPAAHAEAAGLRQALAAHRWRRDETARALGISRATLWRRMRECGLQSR